MIELLRKLRTTAEALAVERTGPLDWEEATRALHELEQIQTLLATASDRLSARVGASWPDHWKVERDVAGVGMVRPYRENDMRRWKHRQLADALVKAHMAQNKGQVPGPYETVRWLQEAVCFSWWKVSVLRRLGINPDDFVEKTKGQVKVRITPITHEVKP